MSVEASFTHMISMLSWFCAINESRHCGKYFSVLYTGIIMLIKSKWVVSMVCGLLILLFVCHVLNTCAMRYHGRCKRKIRIVLFLFALVGLWICRILFVYFNIDFPSANLDINHDLYAGGIRKNPLCQNLFRDCIISNGFLTSR